MAGGRRCSNAAVMEAVVPAALEAVGGEKAFHYY